ncbi:MAG: hypothetical protein SGPRY_009148, partial [Prymnesium sp.]
MLRGRVVLVTGAGGGIGRAAVLQCAREGAFVLAADRETSSAQQTAGLASELGLSVFPFCADVSKQSEVEAMVRACVERFGRLDCALNAAGIEGSRGALHTLSEQSFDEVIAVNTKGTFLCMRAQIAQMLSQPPHPALDASADERGGEAGNVPIDALNYSIVNLASTAAQAGMPEFSAYSASKHAILGLTRSAAKEYASQGVRVNALCPSTTDTPMVQRFAERWPEWQAKQNASFPVGRIGRAEE